MDIKDIQEQSFQRGRESALKEMKGQHGWIPVTERMPEEKQRVLVWVGEFEQIAQWMGYEWRVTWNHDLLNVVTHWMPLPEIPKGECYFEDSQI